MNIKVLKTTRTLKLLPRKKNTSDLTDIRGFSSNRFMGREQLGRCMGTVFFFKDSTSCLPKGSRPFGTILRQKLACGAGTLAKTGPLKYFGIARKFNLLDIIFRNLLENPPSRKS